jgi:phosphoribosyl 1,2-cyclic phosphodiesterase
MRVVFLGTRGYIDVRTKRHRMHSALLITQGKHRLMIDCGEDWRGRVWKVAPEVILLTHAHPDHAGGLRDGAPCPVFATAEAWEALAAFPIHLRRTLKPRTRRRIAGFTVEAFPVVHSVRCPAVGYRIASGRRRLFYVPDVVAIPDRHRALSGVALYIGDGATVTRPLVRRHGTALFGHTTIRAQIGWCAEEGVPRAFITHCGVQIVAGDERMILSRVRALGEERGVEASIAHDGFTWTFGLASPP